MGLVLDLGQSHPQGRYWLAYYVWSEQDYLDYNKNGKDPCQVWHLDPYTPIIPISFLQLSWTHGIKPWCTSNTETLAAKIKKSAPSLVICDFFPYACARRNHGRFVLPSHLLPSCGYGQEFSLREGLIHQYAVNEDNLLETMFSIIMGRSSQTTQGIDDYPEHNVRVAFLKDILQAAVTAFTEEAVYQGDGVDWDKI